MRRPAMLALLALLLVAGPAEADRAAERAKLERARTAWRAHGVRDYSFRLTVSCYCPDAGTPVIVTVRDGRVRGAGRFAKTLGTIPRQFTRISGALNARGAGESVVRYDRFRGYPRSARLNPAKRVIDEEISWTVDRFRSLR